MAMHLCQYRSLSSSRICSTIVLTGSRMPSLFFISLLVGFHSVPQLGQIFVPVKRAWHFLQQSGRFSSLALMAIFLLMLPVDSRVQSTSSSGSPCLHTAPA